VASVVEWTAVVATPATLLGLVRDYSKRRLFLPEGWRFLRTLGAETAAPGAAMEIEALIGPAPTVHIVQLLEAGGDYVIEGPPAGDNYLTTWTVQARGEDAIVQVEMAFTYGGLVGEFFVRRRLRRALREMLRRLKAVAEAGSN